ncbi:MAG TPA: response regulator [Rhodopila sp.]|uniref:ATP-binding response regulator n=1 Tax=Rhodopila sp. TaxID=2480087 RepID=UPI002C9D993E|nr:response regulator [Rhodopila sp.]HVY17078.1 response regulator [Rhodopila sp.]
MSSLIQEQRRPTVLNVDDDAASRYIKTRSLRMGGMDVLEAADGRTALEVIAQRQPLLVLLDVNLPDINGLEVCRRLKSAWPDIIVIQISATSISTTDRVSGLDSGADCYLTTPVEPIELIAVARAMLRLRNAEFQAQEVGERYRMIVESAIDYAIFTCDLDGCVTSWNSGASALLGYDHGEIIGQHYDCLFVLDDVDTGVPLQEMLATGRGESVRSERWHQRRDGSRFWSSGRMVPLRDRRSVVVGALKILYDRSVEKEARDALEALNQDLERRVAERTRDLEAANDKLRREIEERERTEEQIRQLQKMEALGHLTGGIAHDFNNLLMAILGGLEVTRSRVDDPRLQRLLNSSISAAQRGAKLVSQLMAFARKQDLCLEHLQLNALVHDTRALLERSVGPSVSLQLDLAPDAWPVVADASQVQTALLNLAINARDAMPDGGHLRIVTGNVTIDDSPENLQLAPGDYARLDIQDSGTGMTDEVKARLFEPFFTTKDVGKGTGLGLAQVYGFVRQSGGDVRVHSVLGSGTTITILLPRSSILASNGPAPADPE